MLDMRFENIKFHIWQIKLDIEMIRGNEFSHISYLKSHISTKNG